MKVLETANLTYHEWPKEEVALTRSSILSGIIAIGFEYGKGNRHSHIPRRNFDSEKPGEKVTA
jgi:hypothetical protein